MEAKTDLKPRLSVIVPAVQGYGSARAAIESWEAQTVRDQLEVVVVCPDAGEIRDIPHGQVLVDSTGLDLHQARAAGIRHASADFVFLAEDHCVPDRTCAEALLQRVAEGWDAVGPALRSGNPVSTWTQAAFLLGYGQWMMPSGGPSTVLPGHNATIRRARLIEMGAELERELLVSSFLVQRLKERGEKLYVEPRAKMRHFDPPHRWKALRIMYVVGLGFGSLRTRKRSIAFRALYTLAFPAIAFRHWWRGFTQYRRAGRTAGLNPACLVTAILLAAAWGWGESIGALEGVERVEPRIWYCEVKPVLLKDLETHVS